MLWAGQVGTIGIGEPGHWQFYFAAGFGCEVTAFTTESEQGGGGSKLGAPTMSKFKNWRELDLLAMVKVPLDLRVRQ